MPGDGLTELEPRGWSGRRSAVQSTREAGRGDESASWREPDQDWGRGPWDTTKVRRWPGHSIATCTALADGYHTNVVLAALARRAALICPDGFADPAVVEAIAALHAPHGILLSSAEPYGGGPAGADVSASRPVMPRTAT